MKWQVTAALGFTTALSSALLAQSGPTANDQNKKTPSVLSAPITLTGCIKESGGKYSLTNVTPAPTAGADTVANTLPPPSSGHTSYALSGGDLKSHVGHRVEIQGTTMGPAHDRTHAAPPADATTSKGADHDKTGSTSGAGRTESRPGQDASDRAGSSSSTNASGSPHAMMTLNVQSLKMVAMTCS